MRSAGTTMHASDHDRRGTSVAFLRRSRGEQSPPDPYLAAMADLRRAGADPNRPHETRHFMYAPGVKAAQQLARSLRQSDRRIEIETSARKGQWLVVVIQSIPITPDAASELRAELEAAARRVGAEYDYWQVAVAAG
jgi:hypothetical protein